MPIQEAEWTDCTFQDSGLYGGEYWPRKQVHAISITSGNIYPINCVSDVVQSMYVTVISGVCSLWFKSQAGDARPAGDQAHMEFTSGTGPFEIILPPGEHQLIVGAAASLDLVVSIVIMDRERHR